MTSYELWIMRSCGIRQVRQYEREHLVHGRTILLSTWIYKDILQTICIDLMVYCFSRTRTRLSFSFEVTIIWYKLQYICVVYGTFHYKTPIYNSGGNRICIHLLAKANYPSKSAWTELCGIKKNINIIMCILSLGCSFLLLLINDVVWIMNYEVMWY
jgi:hypothetical protein